MSIKLNPIQQTLGRLPSMGKRGRDEDLSLDDGRAAAKAILGLHGGQLADDKLLTPLPYPGIGIPSGQPALELHYIGTRDLFQLIRKFFKGTPRLVIEGPRGFGKSSDLRALAVYLYQCFYSGHTKDVLVCIWNMDAAIEDVVSVVQDALLFAYLVVVEGEKLRAAAAAGPSTGPSSEQVTEFENVEAFDIASTSADPSSEQVTEFEAFDIASTSTDPSSEQVTESENVEAFDIASSSTDPSSEQVMEFENVLVQIQSINSIENAIQFIKGRKKEKQEIFHSFVDGWELIDAKDSAGVDQPRHKDRILVHRKLEQLFKQGKQVWFSVSAKSNAVKPSSRYVIYHKEKPFSNVQCKSYGSSTILGNLSSRQKDIDFYTGRVPLFLDVLCDCCTEFSMLQTADAEEALLTEFKSKRMDTPAAWTQKFESLDSCTSDKQIAELLQEDDNWQIVLKLFREHEEVKRVEESIMKIKLDDGRCHSIEEMWRKDATYFIVQERRYCSGFVHRMYVKGFRAKEAQLLNHAGGAWLPYCSYLLKQPSVNWSDVGWVVEDLVADVVTTREVYFGKTLGKIAGANLKLEEFTEIPELQVEQLLKTIPGCGYYWKPRLFNFPYVDGVICYVDMQGILHIFGLQVTVNVDQHLVSARLFMTYEYLKKWFPDLAAAKNVQLHFVYVGCSEKHKNEVVEDEIQAQVHHLNNGKSYSIAAYKRTFVPLVEALIGLTGVEKKVVADVVARRQLQVPEWPLNMEALYPLKRTELNDIAQRYGLDPKQYSKKEDLVTALVGLVSKLRKVDYTLPG